MITCISNFKGHEAPKFNLLGFLISDFPQSLHV